MIVMMDHYTKLSKVIPTKNSTTIAPIFLEHWFGNYFIYPKLLTDIVPQLVSKFFVAVFRTLGVNNNTTTVYHSRANGQTECFNSNLITRGPHYVCEHQMDWGKYLLLLTYVYNVHVQGSSRCSLSDWRLRKLPLARPGLYQNTPTLQQTII